MAFVVFSFFYIFSVDALSLLFGYILSLLSRTICKITFFNSLFVVVNFLYPWLCFIFVNFSKSLFYLAIVILFYVICNYFSTLYSFIYFVSHVCYTPQIAFYVQLQQIYKLDWHNVVCGRRDKINCSYFCCKGLVRWIHALNKEGKLFTQTLNDGEKCILCMNGKMTK